MKSFMKHLQCLLFLIATARGQNTTNTSPVVVGSCDSTLEEADMMVQLSPSLIFHWTLKEDATTPVLDGVLEYDGEGWLGFGVSPTGEMIGSTALIGLPGTGEEPRVHTLMEKDVEGVVQGEPLVQPEKAVITQAGGKTIMRFVKVLQDDASEGGFTENGLNTFIFAVGESNELAYHKHRGSFRINLSSCEEGTTTSSTGSSTQMTKQGSFAAHGMLAVLAWGVATPFAVTVAWFRTLVPSSWIYIHVFANVLSFFFTVVAVIVAITAKSKQADPAHFTKPHHIVGITLMVLMTFQVFSGFSRPPVEKKVGHYADGHGQELCPRSKRQVWYFLHRVSGVSMLAMGIYQISSGLSLYAEDFTVTSIEPWFWLYVGLFAFFLISLKVWIMMEEHKARQNVGMLSSDHMMDQASEVPSYEIDRDHDDLMLAPTAQFVPTK
eukprot:CAMPEP_0202501344 /NCGR_PEP_ID=MMETSP1361-20130828/35877_1 /ASSEMBLY_ACC=CAM_ASM_000849 /TAXON_ID=210615 /ORGANISM="Staurosira complex sp., Strain CCMP2646" /LENGTH=436 /DNA_ID=CAMNT_0049134059 /DNA_START=91 /DNA_END=1401 /DNA_ORIENTATION=-